MSEPIRYSDGEQQWRDGLLAFAEELAKRDPQAAQAAAEMVAGAYGSADEIRAAAQLGQIRAVVDYLQHLCGSPDTYARAGDLSPQAIGRLQVAVEAISGEIAAIEPSGWALLPGSAYTPDADPPTKPVLNAYQAAVLVCVASGHSPVEIAERRGLSSPKSIRTVLGRSRELLGARTTEHAVAIALQTGEFSYYRAGADHSINRAANRTKEEIAADEFAADVWRWQRQLRADGFHKRFYQGGDARSTAGDEPPEEREPNGGVERADPYDEAKRSRGGTETEQVPTGVEEGERVWL